MAVAAVLDSAHMDSNVVAFALMGPSQDEELGPHDFTEQTA